MISTKRELDKKDAQLLFELDKNSRLSYKQLAKRCGLSAETVRYRVQKMLAQGVIIKFLSIINSTKLGYSLYKVLFRLHNVNKNRIEDFINYLKSLPDILWLTSLDGAFDVGIVISTKSILELDLIMNSINSKFSKNISRKVMSISVFGEYLDRSYLIGKERLPTQKKSYSVVETATQIDSKDAALLEAMSIDGRTPATCLAQKGMKVDTVIFRKKELEIKNILTKYTIVIDHSKLNQIHYKIMIYMNDFNVTRAQEFENFCKMQNRIVYIIKTIGEWDYELDLEVESIQQYKDLMIQITSTFSDIIKDYVPLVISKIHKYCLYPTITKIK